MYPSGRDVETVARPEDALTTVDGEHHRPVEDDPNLEVLVRMGFVDGAGIVRPLGDEQPFCFEGGDECCAVELGHGLVP